ncbi:MAG: hypothetical protein A2V66_09310 [Ignavibacteria bacterium RBG_13_36_8]|nr:MAG: hypothetical protein A2V66_09310 [Ignavibacteria bacterium RBG_13_36_8]
MKKITVLLLILFPISIFAQPKVSMFAGINKAGYLDGDRKVSAFNGPFGICRDSDGNFYVADAGNNCIRKIDKQGMVNTLAGTGEAGYLDGTTRNALFYQPSGVCTDNKGNIFVADFMNHVIRKIARNGSVTTIAGSGEPGFKDGTGKDAEFNYPRGICIDKTGNLYIGDSWNHRIRKITPAGKVTTLAGGGDNIGTESTGSWKDGPAASARFFTPCGLAIDNDGNIYVADALNHRIRKVNTYGYVTTVSGNGPSGWEKGHFADGDKHTAFLNTPTELYVTASGEIFFGDTFNNRVRKVGVEGDVITLADQQDNVNYPRGIYVDETNIKIYFVDSNNNSIKLLEW